MAHKKAAGSSKNGRDSAGQRRGVKCFGGERVKAGAKVITGLERNKVLCQYINTYRKKGFRIEGLRAFTADNDIHTFYLQSGQLAVAYFGAFGHRLHNAPTIVQ